MLCQYTQAVLACTCKCHDHPGFTSDVNAGEAGGICRGRRRFIRTRAKQAAAFEQLSLSLSLACSLPTDPENVHKRPIFGVVGVESDPCQIIKSPRGTCTASRGEDRGIVHRDDRQTPLRLRSPLSILWLKVRRPQDVDMPFVLPARCQCAYMNCQSPRLEGPL